MNPIISPWFFYFAEMLDLLQFFLFISVFGGVVGNLFFLSHLHDNQYPMRKCIPGFVIVFLALIMFILCPGTKTAYKMAAASYATTDNISSVVSNGRLLKEELKKDIIDIINESSESK